MHFTGQLGTIASQPGTLEPAVITSLIIAYGGEGPSGFGTRLLAVGSAGRPVSFAAGTASVSAGAASAPVGSGAARRPVPS